MSARVCILSDTHGVVDERILAEAARCELVIHGGDIGNAEVLDALQATCSTVVAVLGNNDVPAKWPADQRDRLATLPEQQRLELPGGILAVEHGHKVNPVGARHAKLRARHPDARAIVYGHSHRLVVDQEHAPWVLNPGAAGRARTFGGPSCLLLEVGIDHWHVQSLRLPPR